MTFHLELSAAKTADLRRAADRARLADAALAGGRPAGPATLPAPVGLSGVLRRRRVWRRRWAA
jgi:hypothetical protein